MIDILEEEMIRIAGTDIYNYKNIDFKITFECELFMYDICFINREYLLKDIVTKENFEKLFSNNECRNRMLLREYVRVINELLLLTEEYINEKQSLADKEYLNDIIKKEYQSKKIIRI